jgi:geranylgeranyl diphosphate synthase type II
MVSCDFISGIVAQSGSSEAHFLSSPSLRTEPNAADRLDPVEIVNEGLEGDRPMAVAADSMPAKANHTSAQSTFEAAELWRERCERRLDQLMELHCGHVEVCPRLAEAMRYGVMGSGKRVRPVLCFLAAADFGVDPEPLLDFGCALELVHSASLMLDDLPCMDDARLRRGQPAAHVKFGEAVTTLAAIGLLNQAYGVLACADSMAPLLRGELVARLSAAVGTTGLVSGQSRDLCERQSEMDCSQMLRINRQKTAVLFELAVTAGGLHAGLGERRLDTLHRFARHLGMAFQTADDLLDCMQNSVDSGKDPGLDCGKAGSVHTVGVAALRQRLTEELDLSGRVLAELGVHRSALTRYVEALFRRHLA